ncbi:hypothetical protein [Aerococcus urinaeequi]|uniref:hypothetical protein n=1 Tax=Aerococcus urinaeequi TaxID=51665 RepID=UPI003B3BB961
MPRKQYEFKHEPKKRPTWQKWLIGIIAAPIVVIVFLFILGSITGPAEFDDPVVESTSAVESSSDEPSQDELNQQLKDKAIEIDFVTANAGKYEVGTKVKATGEVSLLNDDSIMPSFDLTTESDDGYGLYYVKGFNTSDTEFSNGDIVTVYGTYDGKDEQTGGPKISVTYIEK